MNTTDLIPCECGCGTLIPATGRDGLPRRFVKGHHSRKPGYLDRKADESPPGIIPCRCGCGQTLFNRDRRGRFREFLPGHWSRLQPNQRTDMPCENCGKPTRKAPWHLRRVKHYFCDRKCTGEWASRNGVRRGENNGHFNSITAPCAGCGAPVTKAVSLIHRRNHRVYCPDCIPLTRKGRKGFYVGYPREFNATLRNKIRQRDGQTCQECGKHRDEAGTLHVHHIDYDKNNNAESNLIALCVTCHGQTNFGMPSWQAKFQAIMANRYSSIGS